MAAWKKDPELVCKLVHDATVNKRWFCETGWSRAEDSTWNVNIKMLHLKELSSGA